MRRTELMRDHQVGLLTSPAPKPMKYHLNVLQRRLPTASKDMQSEPVQEDKKTQLSSAEGGAVVCALYNKGRL